MTLHPHLNINLLKMADVIRVEIPFLRICSPQGSVSFPAHVSLEFPSWESWREPFGLCPWGCTVVPEGVVSPWAGVGGGAYWVAFQGDRSYRLLEMVVALASCVRLCFIVAQQICQKTTLISLMMSWILLKLPFED